MSGHASPPLATGEIPTYVKISIRDEEHARTHERRNHEEEHVEWRASHILVKDRGQANEILKQLKTGGDFGALARKYSQCPSRSKGGDLGWFGEGQMVGSFESAVRKLGVGSLSDVVSTQFGFHVIKVTGKR